MSKSKRKQNDMNRVGLQALKDRIEQLWPFPSMKKAAYLEDPAPLRLSDSVAFSEPFVGASVEFRGGSTDVRIYRKADKSDGEGHHHDVDEIRGANQAVITQPAKSEISNHHLPGSISDDLMRRNNLTVAVIPDGRGGMQVNTQPDGTVTALINFEESIPLEESTPGRQTWFCPSCRKRQQINYSPTTDRVVLTHMLRQIHASKSPGCRGDVSVILSALSEEERDEISSYEPA